MERFVSDIVNWDAEDVVQTIARLFPSLDRIPIERISSYLRTSEKQSIDLVKRH